MLITTFYNIKKTPKSLETFSSINFFKNTYIKNPITSKMLWYST